MTLETFLTMSTCCAQDKVSLIVKPRTLKDFTRSIFNDNIQLFDVHLFSVEVH